MSSFLACFLVQCSDTFTHTFMTPQHSFSGDIEVEVVQGATHLQVNPILQSAEKSRTKKHMTTLPTIAVTVISAVSIPLVWAASSLNQPSVPSQDVAQNSSISGEHFAAPEQGTQGDHSTQSVTSDTLRLPIPSLDSALAFFKDRELVALFAKTFNRSSASVTSGTGGAVTGKAGSTSSRARVRIKDLKFPEPPTPPKDSREAQKAYGVYLTAGTAKNMETVENTIQNLVDRGATALVLDIKGSFVYFPVEGTLANEYQLVNPLFDLKEIVRRAHEKGLYVIGRYIAVKDALLADVNNAEFSMRHPKTNVNLETQWVEPSHPTVHEYNRQIIYEAALTGIDEINLDYIRYPTSLPQTLAAIPTEEKSRRIGTFVKMARDAVDAAGMGTKLGISSYAILGWNYAANLPNLGQDVVQFAPMLDVISPMAYPSTFSETGYGSDPGGRSRDYWLVYRTLTGYKELLGPDHDWKLRPWIQAYYKNPKNIRDEIDAVVDAGGCGFTMWSASNTYTDTYIAFNNWKQPEHCL